MNDCKHYKSLVPVPNDEGDYVCVKCGWKFKVLHVVDPVFDAIIQKKKITRGLLRTEIEAALREWKEDKGKK